MKTKLLIFTIVLFSFGASCSPEDSPAITNECNCDKVYYDYGVIGFTNGVIPIWRYTEVGREPATNLDCADDTGTYVQTDNNSFYRIECE